MRDDKLIEAMAILKRMQSYDTEGKDPLAASALRQWAGEVRDALAALQETHAVVPREFEAAMASSGPRSGHSVEVLFKDREGALEFYAALKGLGSDWVQRQLDYIAARKKAAPQTEEAM